MSVNLGPGLTLVRVPPVAEDAPVCWWPCCLASVAFRVPCNLKLQIYVLLTVVTVRWSEPECRSANYFSRAEFWFKKLRNTEFRERRSWCNYVTQQQRSSEYIEDDDDRRKVIFSLLRVTRCQIVWALPPPESYFDHRVRGKSGSSGIVWFPFLSFPLLQGDCGCRGWYDCPQSALRPSYSVSHCACYPRCMQI